MNTTELSKGTRVEVTNGLWKGFKGVIDDIHAESSVIRLTNSSGDMAYALKTDVKAIK